MFFFFQSEQERRVREDVEKNMEICIENPKKYEAAKDVLVMHVSSSNQKAIEQLIDHIKATIKNEDLQPVRKYQAIRLLKDLMLTHNKALGKYVLKKILKRLTIIAQHKTGTKEEADQDRGRDIFGHVKRDQEEYSIKFLTTLLMALEEWGTKWPKTPDGPYKDFHRQYNELVMNGVKFPKYKPKNQSVSPAARTSNLSPVNNRVSIEKKNNQQISRSKSKYIEQKPASSEIKPKLKPSLEKQLKGYFEKIIESINLFCECLESATLEQFPFLREIVAEMEKAGEKGNELIIQLEGGLQNSSEAKKVESVFAFIETLKKQMNIVSKKPEKFEIFQKKYIKSSKATVKLLNQKEKRSVLKQQGSNISVQKKLSTSQIKTESVIQKEPERVQVPKIKNQNRYASVSGDQVLEQFKQIKPTEAADSKAESVSSERFGSFGGPNTERHRASNVTGSPAEQKKNKQEKSNSDRKNESPSIPKPKQRQSRQSQPSAEPPEKLPEVIEPRQSLKPVNSQNTKPPIQLPKNNDKIVSSKEIIPEPREESLDNSANFFKDFNHQVGQKPQVIENPFQVNDSFGKFGSQKSVSKEHSQKGDFFQQIENDNKKAVNQANYIQQRRKSPKVMGESKDPFQNNNIKSQLSDGLSAFDVNRPGDNSEISGNKSDNIRANQPDSKKSIGFDNPFGSENEPGQQSAVNELNKSLNFFTQFQNKSGRQSANQINAFPKEQMGKFDSGNRVQNPFETGNFGKLAEGKKQIRKENPFQTESHHSFTKKTLQKRSPFGNHSFENDGQSHGSKRSGMSKNPFQTENNPFSERKSNPFDTQQNSGSNPFETSLVKDGGIQQILQIFKPPTAKVIEDISQNNSFSNIQKIRGPITTSPLKASENPRESIVFTVQLDRQSEPGLNFSQFADIQANPQRISNPFATDIGQRVSNQHNQSGFSLSNFAPIGGPDPFASARPSEMINAENFFQDFEKRSKASKASRIQKQIKQIQSINHTQNIFGEFNNKIQESIKISHEGSKRESKGFVQNQKTEKSSSEKSFDFSKLQNISKINKNRGAKVQQPRQIQFEQFGNWGQNETTSRKGTKEGIPIQNASQKSLSWGDFDINNKTGNSAQKQDKTPDADEVRSNILSVHSRTDLSKIREHPATDRLVGSQSKLSPDESLNLNLQDFAPLSKKGVQWNPLSLIPNLKPLSLTYNLDHNKLKDKRTELQIKKKQYDEKVQIFKEAKQKSNQVRSKLLEKMSIVDEIITSKQEYQQILKQIKQANEIKEKQIEDINRKTKVVEEIRAKILQKQKQLYELTKNQLHVEERKTPVQRTTATKWELFNKNLQKNRTAIMNSRSSYGY